MLSAEEARPLSHFRPFALSHFVFSTYVNADQVEGVYVRAWMVPQQYQRGRFARGVILIWTREHA